MKFICPQCKSEQEIEVYMSDAIVSCAVEVSEPSELKYGYPEIHESINNYYCCRKCGWRLPVEPNSVDDDALLEWLEQQEYNQGEKTEAKKFNKPGICPKCGSNNVDFGDFEFQGNSNSQKCLCADCFCRWNEIYVYATKEIVEG